MKTIAISLLVFYIQTNTNIYAQLNTENHDSLIQQLKGIWYVVNSYPSTHDSLVFGRQSTAPYNWGDRIEINENGDFVDAYSAKCGNDTRIHNDSGNWKLDKSGSIIQTTIPIYLESKKHKILRLTTDTLVLQKIE